jgi:ribosomal protein S27AE
MTHAMEDRSVQVCRNCGNVFMVELLKNGDEYNDFGMRFCPYCGLVTEEYAHLSNK